MYAVFNVSSRTKDVKGVTDKRRKNYGSTAQHAGNER